MGLAVQKPVYWGTSFQNRIEKKPKKNDKKSRVIRILTPFIVISTCRAVFQTPLFINPFFDLFRKVEIWVTFWPFLTLFDHFEHDMSRIKLYVLLYVLQAMRPAGELKLFVKTMRSCESLTSNTRRMRIRRVYEESISMLPRGHP